MMETAGFVLSAVETLEGQSIASSGYVLQTHASPNAVKWIVAAIGIHEDAGDVSLQQDLVSLQCDR